MIERVCNVLFLCTCNSARSIMAEGILRRDGAGRFNAWSAGSQPKPDVNPLALQTLAHKGYPNTGLRSKSWLEFDAADALPMDVIITVCDNAAAEACPIWPGHPLQVHWGIEDPAAVAGTHSQRLAAFGTAFGYLHQRIARLLALPIATLEPGPLRAQLAAIGHDEGASSGATRNI